MEKTIIYQDQEFRKYEPEIVKDRHGTLIEMTLCEELTGGGGNPFIQQGMSKKGADVYLNHVTHIGES
jgi:hypothetical protein